jgi:hypothetical protein
LVSSLLSLLFAGQSLLLSILIECVHPLRDVVIDRTAVATQRN